MADEAAAVAVAAEGAAVVAMAAEGAAAVAMAAEGAAAVAVAELLRKLPGPALPVTGVGTRNSS